MSSSAAQEKSRLIARIFVVIFSISVLFALVAAFRNTAGKLLPVAGAFDVALAFLSFGLLVALTTMVSKERVRIAHCKAYALSAQLSSIALLLLLLYFINVRVNWEILLVGLGWRYWLLTTALPYLLSAFQKEETQ